MQGMTIVLAARCLLGLPSMRGMHLPDVETDGSMDGALELLRLQFPPLETMANEIAHKHYRPDDLARMINAAAVIHHFKMGRDVVFNNVMNSSAVLHPDEVVV